MQPCEALCFHPLTASWVEGLSIRQTTCLHVREAVWPRSCICQHWQVICWLYYPGKPSLSIAYHNIWHLFQYTPDTRYLLGDFASRLPGNSQLPLWAKQLSKPWCLVSVCIWLSRCWWLRSVTSFQPPLDFPWNLACTRLEWLLLEWTVNTAQL